jgi:hypothetical protein
MATISTFLQDAGGKGNPGRSMYTVEKEIDLAATGANPSTDDVVQVLSIPAGTMIMSAGVEVIEVAVQNTGTDATVDAGTSTDDDEWVAAFDIDGASVGDYAPVAAAATTQIDGVANTLDLTFAGTGVSFTAGKLRVFAVLMEVSSLGSSKAAAEVDRDTLA